MSLIVRSLLTLTILATIHANAADVVTTKIPVQINIPAEDLAKMSPEDRQMVEQVRQNLEKNVWTYDQFTLEPPETVFTDGEVIVRFADLFQKPSGNELRELSTGVDGKPLRLSAPEIESIRDTGLLIIPSKRYPGQNHVWKVSLWLQKGRENIAIDLERGKANALGQLIIQIPDRLVAEHPISARRGLINMYKGLRGAVSLTIGLIEKTPAYSDARVSQILRDAMKSYIESELKGQIEEFDDRLSDITLQAKLDPLVRAIVSKIENAWPKVQEEIVPEMIEKLDAKGLSSEEIAAELKKELEGVRLEQFYKDLTEDPALEAASPGIGKILVNRDRTLRMTLATEAQIAEDVNTHETHIGQQLESAFPLRALIPAWKQRMIAESTRDFYPEQRELRTKELFTLLRQEGLTMEAARLETSAKFMKEKAADIRAHFTVKELAARTIELETRIYFAKNWIRGESLRSNGTKEFYPIQYEASSVASDSPGWRITLFAKRATMIWKNWNYALVMTNLLNGPLGLKSAFYPKTFYPWMTMNRETGALEIDKINSTSTLLARHEMIWNYVGEAKKDFESHQSRGFISKDTLRPFYYGLTNFKGAAMTAGLWTLQPVATGVNLLGTTALVVTSFPWAPLVSGIRWMWDSSIRDTANPPPSEPYRFPMLQKTVFLGGLGTLETAAAVTAAGVVHPLIALKDYGWGELKAKSRTAWDFLMAAAFLKRANMPAGDDITIRRISGPDISSDYLFQVPVDLVLVSLQAYLEGQELRTFDQKVTKLTQEPELALKTYIEATVGNARLLANQNESWVKDLHDNATRLREEATKTLAPRFDALPKPVSNQVLGRVRLTKEDLAHVLAAGEPLVKAAWERRIRPLLGEDEAAVWQQQALVMNDYAGLSRTMLQNIFGTEILTSMEENDEQFVLRVNAPNYGALLDRILSGENIQPGDFKEQDKLPLSVSELRTRVQLDSLVSASPVSKDPCEILLR